LIIIFFTACIGLINAFNKDKNLTIDERLEKTKEQDYDSAKARELQD